MKKNGTKEIKKNLKKPKLSPLCRADCTICNSDYVEEIHKLLKAKTTYKNICAYLLKNYGFKTSPASIARHYRNFKIYRKTKIEEKMIVEVDKEANKIVRHQKQAIKLADIVYNKLLADFKAGILKIEISDWEKIVKLYHQVLTGDGDTSADELVAIFQQAAGKYGYNTKQGVLFKNNKTN